MNKLNSVLVRCLSYSFIGLLLAFPVQAIVWSYTDKDIQVLQLTIKKLELEIQLLKASPRLGAASRDFQRIASTTPSYFGTNEGTRTGTTTLLTVGSLSDSDHLSLGIQNSATSTGAGTVYIRPKVSYYNITLY